MTTATHHPPAIVAAFFILVALLAIGVLIWQALPKRSKRERDIERQITTLRDHADRDVARRPRVRATSTPAGTASTTPRKACGGGQCRHRADCSDRYCPGRLSASLTGANQQ